MAVLFQAAARDQAIRAVSINPVRGIKAKLVTPPVHVDAVAQADSTNYMNLL